MPLTRLTSQAAEDLVLGGEVSDTDNAYKNYDQVISRCNTNY